MLKPYPAGQLAHYPILEHGSYALNLATNPAGLCTNDATR